MADSRASAALTPEQWDAKFFKEYLTENRFAGEMGTNESNIIQVKENLSKGKGDTIHFALVNKLTNDATTGSATMEGSEEALDTRDFSLTIDKRRNAIRVPEIEEQYSAIDLRNAGRAVLMDWSQKDTENLLINALISKNGVAYASASEAQKDAWLVDNADRVLFGAARSNNPANDHSASLLNVDTTNDLITPAALSKMKAIAYTVADPKIRPIRSTVNKGRRYYMVYLHSYLFNDLKNNTTITQAQREVSLQMENERLFEGGDLYWDGMIIKEIEEATDTWNLGAVGNGGATVCAGFLCGAQALAVGYGRRWRTKTEEFDYGDKFGVEISSIYGVEKTRFETGVDGSGDWKDHGVVTGYFATLGLT